ncbi:hypothetical protein FA13DRAFT_948400 [Coprinellus micaceus]|uniref:Uncharacterized protein n=1 Tax=Coprinellus micaceus TaxID=71717 RepID=A0A4Y7SZN2_COPMI|nr:hypothetical protein FA13DRAFT_948400 [Coprinellus micaceus]
MYVAHPIPVRWAPDAKTGQRRAGYDLSRTAQSPPPTGASTGSAYRAPPNRPSNAEEQQRGYYTSPSPDAAHSSSWLMPLYALLSIIAILVGELIGFLTSGSRLPSPISRFNPSRLARLYPGPVRERSATIQDILAFLQALSKNGPLSLEPGPMVCRLRTSWRQEC